MKQYLGDGVYVEFNGYSFELTTENGVSITNTIFLEPEVVDALQAYIKNCYNQQLTDSLLKEEEDDEAH